MQNSESLSNAVPIPGRPGEPPKKRYIAGVDQTDRVEPWMLADRDSRFAEFYGVQLHYKIEHPPSGRFSHQLKLLSLLLLILVPCLLIVTVALLQD